ncbi:hypothetical protein M231_05868 [Tremella mesenterica]|uniref:BTB domain-containing protein n=1 Tax=Tremella mesenterica TaxID=5217 RepID=A0A4Q1BH28_TREME|nr:hypothetical protein M231_05868 [Tremella mesenterica]
MSSSYSPISTAAKGCKQSAAVLHLAASSLTTQSYTFFQILLRNPNVSVNLQDHESGYTALHRALFAGNIHAARDLLQRNDIDIHVKDAEGLTAFELYNGTVDGTSPPKDVMDGTDLFVWGVNRNFALGTGDSTDKAYPDRVNLQSQDQFNGHPDPTKRFSHVGVQDVVMGKLHTGVITSENRGNLSLCGFGSNGRLGRSIHSQLSLLPMADLPHTIISIALGPDHTLALTSGGYILSWGRNRFAQLGYVMDPSDKPIDMDGQVQMSPRRIVGPLKKEFVRGVAAGRMASACWTADAVWTWGTNGGNLGYDKNSNPVQVMPRKVTAISQPVVDIALSDHAMICLLDTSEVICFHHDVNFKISFSTPRVLSEAYPFRPPQSTLRPMIKKVTSCNQTFAALSSIGDVFTFTLPNPAEESKDTRDRHVIVKPQLIWALRKRFDAVRDVALGSDGTVIICTSAGHVFVRQRAKTGSGQLKFKRVPYLQRVIKVAANEAGAFAAIRVDAKPKDIKLIGPTLEEDIFSIQPHIRRLELQMSAADFEERYVKRAKQQEDEDDDESNNSVIQDIKTAIQLCTVLSRWRISDDTLFSWPEPLASDIHLVVGHHSIPAHSLILKLRSPILSRILSGETFDRFSLNHSDGSTKIRIEACHPLVALLLMQYLYSDEISAIWDPRVSREILERFPDLQLPITNIKTDLKIIADILKLDGLSVVLQAASKVSISQQTLSGDLQRFFDRTNVNGSEDCDITLCLEDREVRCSSTILRARCPFFEAMFADGDWMESQGVVEMRHLRWRPMRLVFRWIHEGVEDEFFDYLHQETLDEFLDFVFEVLAAATELLLDRLVLVCSRVITRHINAFNASALACEASFYQAIPLKEAIFDYIIVSLETMLESGLLDEMDDDVLHDLSNTIVQKQSMKIPIPRTEVIPRKLMEKYKDWLALQDLPIPRIRQKWKPRSPLLTPADPRTPRNGKKMDSPMTSPLITPATTTEDIFAMDEDTSPPGTASSMRVRPMTPLDLGSGSKAKVWKSRTVESGKKDLRSIMAETAAANKTPSRPTFTSTPSSLTVKPSTTPQSSQSPSLSRTSVLSKSPTSKPTALTGSPWRPIEPRRPSITAVQTQQSTPPLTSTSIPSSLSRATGTRNAIPPAGSSKVIVPIKSAPIPSRKTSGSGAAWTIPTFAPAPPILSASVSPGNSLNQSMSLLAIQRQEQDLADRHKGRAVASFADILAEEKRAGEERERKREEEDFSRWWEEERARLEREAMGVGRGGGRGRNGPRAVNARGRGRGKVGQDGMVNVASNGGQGQGGMESSGHVKEMGGSRGRGRARGMVRS